jgi:AraC-like DNA-binding protein
MAEDAYGQGLSERVGAETSATLDLDLFPNSGIAVTRVAWEGRREGRYSCMPVEDASMLCLELRDLPTHPYWVDGRPTEIAPIRRGDFTLLDLRQQHASELRDALDCLAAYLPHAALQVFAEEHDTPRVDGFRIPPAMALDDAVVRGLMTALLPAMENPRAADRLFLDHVALALIAHMTATHGEVRSNGRGVTRGGLAAWQERRAKEALLASIDGNIGLGELAGLCGLSRSHFARAFKQSTGLPPHRWLLARRIERAQELLLHSALSLDRIAAACGFADQSHFSRVFSRQIGIAPSAWRRQRRSA